MLSSLPGPDNTAMRPFNQLQFTCRQLAYETARREVKLNEIAIFPIDCNGLPVHPLARIHDVQQSFKLKVLTRVTLCSYSRQRTFLSIPEPFGLLRAVAEYANDNPTTSITYRFVDVAPPTPWDCLLMAVYVLAALNGFYRRAEDHPFVLMGYVSVKHLRSIAQWRYGDSTNLVLLKGDCCRVTFRGLGSWGETETSAFKAKWVSSVPATDRLSACFWPLVVRLLESHSALIGL